MTARRDGDILPAILFPGGIDGAYLTGMSQNNHLWQPGDLYHIRYPLGKGFMFRKEKPGRLLMISGTENPLRLLPVAGMTLANGGEAALFTYHLPEDIPVEIEILTRDQLLEALAWADCVIGDTNLDHLAVWSKLAGGGESARKQDTQVLVDTPMVCSGTAECGVCAVKTRRGWKYACSDGPVFQLAELEI